MENSQLNIGSRKETKQEKITNIKNFPEINSVNRINVLISFCKTYNLLKTSIVRVISPYERIVSLVILHNQKFAVVKNQKLNK